MELSSDTTELLRPNQIAEMHEEIRGLEESLNAPPHIRSQITDRGAMRGRLQRLKAAQEKLTPRPFTEGERDVAVAEFDKLADQIRAGMPSSEEMRRNAPGAVGKHTSWQHRTKKAVARYKHLALRLMAGGDVPSRLRNQGDVANIELLRPLKTSHDISQEGAQIPKTTDFHFGADPVNAVKFSDAEIEALKVISPELESQLAVLGNEVRAGIKTMLQKAMGPTAAEAVPEATTAIPSIASLSYNQMKSMAAKANIDTKSVTRQQLIVALRDRKLAR